MKYQWCRLHTSKCLVIAVNNHDQLSVCVACPNKKGTSLQCFAHSATPMCCQRMLLHRTDHGLVPLSSREKTQKKIPSQSYHVFSYRVPRAWQTPPQPSESPGNPPISQGLHQLGETLDFQARHDTHPTTNTMILVVIPKWHHTYRITIANIYPEFTTNYNNGRSTCSL